MVERLLRYRGYIILTMICALILGGYVLYEHRPQPEPLVIVEPTMAPTQTPSPIQVHVAGAVRNPGVYAFPPGTRLVRAVEAAGGMTDEADQESVNLADPLQDGRRVYIPRRGSPIPPQPTAVAGESQVGPSSSQPGSRGIAQPPGGTININTASAAELDALPGIGPVLAERIVVYRQAEGPFTDPAQLMKVKGIGEATYARIKTQITLR
jgi:competence protein ComEA